MLRLTSYQELEKRRTEETSYLLSVAGESDGQLTSRTGDASSLKLAKPVQLWCP